MLLRGLILYKIKFMPQTEFRRFATMKVHYVQLFQAARVRQTFSVVRERLHNEAHQKLKRAD